MKKAIFCIFVLFICAGLFAQQPVVAVAPFDAISGINATEANMISRSFNIRLGNTHKVILVDRDIVERIIMEHSFQAGDWSNQQKTAELGKALNANWIVRGNFEKFGNNVLFTVSFYDIATFQFKGGDEIRVVNADAAYDQIPKMVDNLITVIERTDSVPAVSNPARSAAPAGKTYNIGDRGPGGGFIFSIGDGIYWECSMDLGTYTWENAVKAARSHRGGGFTDWRIPHRQELVSIYSFSRRGLSGFSSNDYWSSSEGEYLDFGTGWWGYRSKVKKKLASVCAVRFF